jgi:hypothetical protein
MPVYLFQRLSRFYVRTWIPPELRSHFQLTDRPPSKDFKSSLLTNNLRVAKYRGKLTVDAILVTIPSQNRQILGID